MIRNLRELLAELADAAVSAIARLCPCGSCN